LNSAEIKWIALLGSTKKEVGYNRSIGGDGGRSGFKDSPETRRKKSLGMLGKRNALGNGKRREMSDEHRKAISIAMQGIKRDPMPEERKERISKKMSGRKISFEHKNKIAEGMRRYRQSLKG